jgi:aminoglycoside/choline kinase family phosphotransferase
MLPACPAPPHDDTRRQALLAWLRTCAPGPTLRLDTLRPASSDASFRRYFRVDRVDPAAGSLIAMDAPPEREDSGPFVHVAALFAAAGASTPQVFEADLDQGFLLLSDLGPTTYAEALADPARDEASVEQLYRDALATLVRLQAATREQALPPYDRARLLAEMRLFPDWYVARHLGATLAAAQAQALESVFEQLTRAALAQPQVYVHRDYHCRNLMVLAQGNPGVLDFQDAVLGPVTYDLVSLLRDAYVDWTEERQIDWSVRWWEQARAAGVAVGSDFGQVWRDFEWMGLQRHLKVLGIFARLAYRDGKERYLADLPRVMRHTLGVARRYDAFAPLVRLLESLPAPGGTGRPAA